MAAKPIIRLGDPTSHGGVVIEAFPTLNIYGKPAAGIGHLVSCPKCKGSFPIVAGASNSTFMGKNIALEGMLTACGAVLIATQNASTVDDVGGGAKTIGGVKAAAAASSKVAEPESQEDELEYYFVAIRDDGSAVNLAYRIDADSEKLHEGIINAKGETKAFPLSQIGEVTFWIPQQ